MNNNQDSSEHAAEPDAAPSLSTEGFNAAYAGTPPWDIGRPQPVFATLARTGGIRGRVLDAGCGTGEHALLAASMGLATIGIDSAPAAIERAKAKARDRQLQLRFLVWDALDLPGLGEHFETVLDCGLFHVFDDDTRAHYVESLRAVIVPEGRYAMLCFSEHQPGDWGPRRVSQDEIRASFNSGWKVESIESAAMQMTNNPDGILAWLSTIIRV